jgi:GNAT superfamily N-acetyltransferase
MGRDPSAHSSIAVAPGSTPPERGGLDPVLARERAEPATAVLRLVEEDPVAVVALAGAEPAGVTRPDQPSEALGTDGRRHRNKGGVDRMVVQPPLAVLLGQVRLGRVRRQQVVEPASGGIEIAALQLDEHAAEATGQSDEARDVPLAQLLGRRWIDREDPPDGRERLDLPYRPTEGDLDGELVDQLDGHARTRLLITVKTVLTSHVSHPRVVTSKRAYGSYCRREELPTMTLTAPAVLRSATPADADAICAIWHAGWRDGHLGHVPPSLLSHRSPADIAALVPPRVDATTVAITESRVVGFVTVRHDEIEELYVDAVARGTGVADVLLEHGEEAVRSAFDRAWLAVVAGNRRARRFYERNGWSNAGAFDNPAPTPAGDAIPVPALRYEKQLAASADSHDDDDDRREGGRGPSR